MNEKQNKKEIARELWKRVNKRFEEIVEYKQESNNEKLNKIAKNLQLTKRYFEDHSIEFSFDFQEKFKKLYFRGFLGSLGSQENLKELHDLKDDFRKEIEKIVQKKETKEHVAVKMTGSAKNNLFINSKINGGLELGGQNNNFIETKIFSLNQRSKKNPVLFWTIISTIALLLGLFVDVIFVGNLFGILPKNIEFIPSTQQTKISGSATSLDRSIFSIIYESEQKEYSSALDKQVTFKRYSKMHTQTEYAFIKHIQEDINEKVVNVLLESVDWYNGRPISIWCFFKNEWLQKLSTLDQEKSIKFNGIVGNYSNGIVFLANCELD